MKVDALNTPLLKRAKEGWRRHALLGGLAALLLTPLILICFIDNPDDPYSPEVRHLNALRQIAAETPVHPAFAKLATTEMAKNTGSLIVTGYRVSGYAATYSEVKDFYIRELTARGWKFIGEDKEKVLIGGEHRSLKFRKDEYQIDIYYDDKEPLEYHVDYVWDWPD